MPTKQNRLRQMYLQTSMKTSSLNSTEIRATILRRKKQDKAQKLHKSITMLYNRNLYIRTQPWSMKKA